MSDFSGNTRDVKAVRKAHECEQCRKKVEIGDPAKYAFGIWEGYPYSIYTHPECNAAAREYADLNDLWGEEYPWFSDMDDSEHGHHAWLLEKHPIVAARLGVETVESGNQHRAAVSRSPALCLASSATRNTDTHEGEDHV